MQKWKYQVLEVYASTNRVILINHVDTASLEQVKKSMDTLKIQWDELKNEFDQLNDQITSKRKTNPGDQEITCWCNIFSVKL